MTSSGNPNGLSPAQPEPGTKAERSEEIAEKAPKTSWLWPLGVAVTSVAGMLVLALRGCWHRRMSWPVRAQGHSYQVCLGCGVKRLFDEERFCSYGPFRYDLSELIDWANTPNREPRIDPTAHRPAS
ncbi:MAG: hypothetical protein WCB53_02170 [Terriglobales bacterium]